MERRKNKVGRPVATDPRSAVFGTRFNNEELGRFIFVMEQWGMSPSEAIRKAVDEAYFNMVYR